MDCNFVPIKRYVVLIFIIFAIVPHSTKAFDEPPPLYNSTDKVKILTNENFNSEVLYKNHSTLVQFYNSYCGHCRRFSPVYKELAEYAFGWRNVVPITALDCSVEANNGICRHYGIRGYPTLQYFGPQHPSDKLGADIQTQILDEILKNLAQFIVAENKTSDMTSWPDFEPVQSTTTVSSLIERLDSFKKYVILVYEAENSTVGVEMILHFLRHPNIIVKRITDDEVAHNYQIDIVKYKMACVSRQGHIVPFYPRFNINSYYKEAIEEFLSSHQITAKSETEPTISTISEVVELNQEQMEKLAKIIEEVKRNKHLVYQADLEIAIRNILHNEIPKAPEIFGEKLSALQKFFEVLNRYNPLSSSGRLMISKLNDFVSFHNQTLSGGDFENAVNRLETQLGSIFTSTRFVGCTGSRAGLRGYSCSLWQLFHFMTVQAADSKKSQDPLEILNAMHGYIKYFFGCTDCSEHFQDMAAKREYQKTRTKDDAILWLWSAHNEVNQRLAGDETEDPQFPKIQFPSLNSCPQCYKKPNSYILVNSEITWNKNHVLQFLKNIYNPLYISQYGRSETLQPIQVALREKRMISNVFSEMDMGMGLFLYGFCIIMLVAAFKVFAFKKFYRKKSYRHDMLGKV